MGWGWGLPLGVVGVEVNWGPDKGDVVWVSGARHVGATSPADTEA